MSIKNNMIELLPYSPKPKKETWSFGELFGMVLFILIIGFFVWGVYQVSERHRIEQIDKRLDWKFTWISKEEISKLRKKHGQDIIINEIEAGIERGGEWIVIKRRLPAVP